MHATKQIGNRLPESASLLQLAFRYGCIGVACHQDSNYHRFISLCPGNMMSTWVKERGPHHRCSKVEP